jgi:ATP-dependent Lhr-like helicase
LREISRHWCPRPLFGGQGGAIDDEVVAEMRRLYEGEEMPAFLDGAARTLLSEARRTYHDLGLGRVRMIPWEGHTLIFPWAGTAAAYTLMLALKKSGLAASLRGFFIEVAHAPIDKVSATLELLAGAPPPDPALLVNQLAKLERNKFDRFLPHALLALDFTAERLTPTAVTLLAGEIVEAGAY